MQTADVPSGPGNAFDDPGRAARQVGRILPEAVARSTESSEDLAEALRPAVETALGLSATKDSRRLVQALFPVMGAALREAFMESLRRRLLALNRFLLHHFSLYALKWRIEAFWTRTPFSQVVLQHTATFPVDQVFLIHRKTGLLLQQVQKQRMEPRDGDMISGMLTAIQDFVHDSFKVQRSDRLETIQVGDLTVCVEQGPLAVLAGIVKGTPPQGLRTAFREALKAVHKETFQELDSFSGDVSAFAVARRHLEACLTVPASLAEQRIMSLTWLVVLAPVAALVTGIYLYGMHQAAWKRYVTLVGSKPGIIVLDEGRRYSRHYIIGLRDPAAIDPVELLQKRGFRAEEVESVWKPYEALEPAMVLARAQRLLDPPSTVTLGVEDGALTAEGTAPREWIERAELVARSLAGISTFQTDRLVPAGSEGEAAWKSYLAALAAQPGLVVVAEGMRDGKRYVSGLRDPLAADPAALLAQAGIKAESVSSRWQSYPSLDAPIVLIRAKEALGPPPSVTLQFANGVLSAEGKAPHAWIQTASVLARGLAGVSTFKTDALIDQELKELNTLRTDIEGQTFFFLGGKPDLGPGQDRPLRIVVDKIRQFQRTAARIGQEFTVEVRGHTKGTGSEETDASVSESVARSFIDVLKWQNVDVQMFTARGMGSASFVPKMPSPKGPLYERQVTLKVSYAGD